MYTIFFTWSYLDFEKLQGRKEKVNVCKNLKMLVKNVFVSVTVTVSSYLYLLLISCMVEHRYSVMSLAIYKL